MSLVLRDTLLKQCWVPSNLRVPDDSLHGPHYPVTVWGVIDDPRYRLNGEPVFMDVVAWWPASRVWTVTSQCRADEDVDDTPVTVTWWQPLPPLPY